MSKIIASLSTPSSNNIIYLIKLLLNSKICFPSSPASSKSYLTPNSKSLLFNSANISLIGLSVNILSQPRLSL